MRGERGGRGWTLVAVLSWLRCWLAVLGVAVAVAAVVALVVELVFYEE